MGSDYWFSLSNMRSSTSETGQSANRPPNRESQGRTSRSYQRGWAHRFPMMRPTSFVFYSFLNSRYSASRYAFHIVLRIRFMKAHFPFSFSYIKLLGLEETDLLSFAVMGNQSDICTPPRLARRFFESGSGGVSGGTGAPKGHRHGVIRYEPPIMMDHLWTQKDGVTPGHAVFCGK